MTTAKGYTEMKDSGIQWIGQIPTHWLLKKAKYCVSITNGSDPKSEGSVPVYGSGSESFKTCGEYKEGPAVLIGRKGATLHIPHYIEGRYWNVDTAFDVKPQEDFSLRYYYYLACVFDYNYYISQTTLPGMTQTNYNNMKLPCPSLDEQTAIASYLDAQCAKIDEIIAQAKASIEDYKQWKASIIYEAVTKGLNPNVEMKDSGIEWVGNVPAHWRVTKIKNFVSLRSGITLGKQYPPDAQLVSRPYLRVANVKAEHVDLQDVATIMVTIEEAEKYALKPGELLMTEGGDRDKLGRGTIWHGEIPGCLHQNHVFAVQVDEKYMLTKFLDYLTASPVGREYFDLTAKKTTNLASTNATTILQFSVPIPPLTEQEKIITILDRNTATINEVIAEKETLVSDLESYKKSLIYEVVTGKRRVISNG